MEWTIYYNDDLVYYLLGRPNINTNVVKFIKEDGSWYLVDERFHHDGKVRVETDIVCAIQAKKTCTIEQRIRKDALKVLFLDTSLDAVFYSNKNHLKQLGSEYARITAGLFEGIDGNVFKLVDDPSIKEKRREELNKVREKYFDLGKELPLDIYQLDDHYIDYNGMYPKIHIRIQCMLNACLSLMWIRNVYINDRGKMYVQKLRVTLEDPHSKQDLFFTYSDDSDEINIKYLEQIVNYMEDTMRQFEFQSNLSRLENLPFQLKWYPFVDIK